MFVSMKLFENRTFIGERAQFMSSDKQYFNCVFKDGESPLKESKNIDIRMCEFQWKYPIWYSHNVKVINSKFLETARSGVWYTDHIEIIDSCIDAPKTFRRSSNIKLVNVDMLNAKETFWNCQTVELRNVKARGDYFGFNSEHFEISELYLDGNYCFDGAKNITIRNSTLNSKDSFWNSENITVIDCIINGEYLAWNAKNLTFINCKIISHQGLCYMENVRLINCELIDTDLCFEFCKDIDADIVNVVDSIKNPSSGIIRVKGVKELILEEEVVNRNMTTIVIDGKQI